MIEERVYRLPLTPDKPVSLGIIETNARVFFGDLQSSKLTCSISVDGTTLEVRRVVKRKDAFGGTDDSRLTEFLLFDMNGACDDMLEEWKQIVVGKFSIGGLRRIMRESSDSTCVQVAEWLYSDAIVNKGNPLKALRALSLWPYWSREECTKLIDSVLKSREPVGTTAAYILTRLDALWLRTLYCSMRDPYLERSALITRIIYKTEIEAALLTLRWEREYRLPLHPLERRNLTAFLKNVGLA